jgi:hypothetical protein
MHAHVIHVCALRVLKWYGGKTRQPLAEEIDPEGVARGDQHTKGNGKT